MDSADNQGARGVPHSGEAAWRAAKEGVAARNAQVRRVGKLQRQAHEQQAAQARAAAERRELADLIDNTHR